MSGSIKSFAPASVANVAVGFDILGFALEKPGDEIIVRPGTEPGLKSPTITGAKNKLPLDLMQNTAGYAAFRLLQHLGEEKGPSRWKFTKNAVWQRPGLFCRQRGRRFFAVNEWLKTGLTKAEILRFAVEGEQIADGAFHADNVAPSLLGGLVLIRDNESLDFKKSMYPGLLWSSSIPTSQF